MNLVHTFFVKSRVLGIKKINALKFVIIKDTLLFVASIFISIFVLNKPEIWFFFFCIFVGEYLLVKSYLYKTDSNCYLGATILALGLFYLTNAFIPFGSDLFFILGSFAVGSIATFIFYKQIFQFFVSLIFITTILLEILFRQNLINIYIFLLLIMLNVFIFLFIYARMRIRK